MTVAYARADTLQAALSLLAGIPDACLVNGGQSLFSTGPALTGAEQRTFVDISRLEELRRIECDTGTITLGAGLTHGEIAAAEAVPTVLRNLAEAIGDPMVRARGTLGGALAQADPNGDWPAALLALDGVVCTDRRDLMARDFFLSARRTALEADEILVEARFQLPKRAAYQRQMEPASRYPLVAVMVAQLEEGPRVAVTGAADHVFRWKVAERALARGFPVDALDEFSADDINARDDDVAGAAYRRQLTLVLARRALTAACGA